MSEKELKILETFGKIIPNLTEVEKEKLLSYGQGYAEAMRSRGDGRKAELSGKAGEVVI